MVQYPVMGLHDEDDGHAALLVHGVPNTLLAQNVAQSACADSEFSF